jgi:hypothetical protein
MQHGRKAMARAATQKTADYITLPVRTCDKEDTIVTMKPRKIKLQKRNSRGNSDLSASGDCSE